MQPGAFASARGRRRLWEEAPLVPPPFPAVGQDPWNRLLRGLKPLPRVVAAEETACGLWDASDRPRIHLAGVGSFLLYSVHEGIRGIPLDPNDKSDALVPVSGTSLAVGIDFHAGDVGLGVGQQGWRGRGGGCHQTVLWRHLPAG